MRRSERGGKTVYLENVGIWWNEAHNRIHIALPGTPDIISTVNPRPESARGNPNLFWKLARCLQRAGAPHPPMPEDEGEDLNEEPLVPRPGPR